MSIGTNPKELPMDLQEAEAMSAVCVLVEGYKVAEFSEEYAQRIREAYLGLAKWWTEAKAKITTIDVGSTWAALVTKTDAGSAAEGTR